MMAGAADPRRAGAASTNYKEVREINIFAVVLVVQSLPFLAAVGLALIERSRSTTSPPGAASTCGCPSARRACSSAAPERELVK